MSRPETEDIAKVNLVVPSHKPLAGADEPPIDAGLQDTPQRQRDRAKQEKDTQAQPGLSHSTEKNRLF